MTTIRKPIDRLREDIKEKRVVILAGAGVSSNVTKRQAPGWKQLIESGVEQCVSLFPEEPNWAVPVRALLDQSDAFPNMLITAAEMVQSRLCQQGAGDFKSWLRAHFESLKASSPATIHAIEALKCPILTTNYDGLLEQVTGQNYVTWKDADEMFRVVRGEDRRILHLHGHWERPETVILGIRSYAAISGDEFSQAVLRAFGVGKSILFIGCSDSGLSDPNIGNFLKWLNELENKASPEHQHYRLVRSSDLVKRDGRIFPIPYGPAFEDLADFLGSLAPKTTKRRRTTGQSRAAEAAIESMRPGAITAYLARLEAETSTLNLMGFGRRLTIQLPIREAYVPLEARFGASLELKRTGRSQRNVEQGEPRIDVSKMFVEAGKRKQRGVILLGDPGSGKTTVVRQLAWRLSSHQALPEDLGLPERMIPVMLRFRELDTSETGTKGLRDFLISQTECPLEADALTSPGTDLWNYKGGPLLWILDGLDEIIDHELRKQVSGWLRAAIQSRTRDRFLVTCRFAGYHRDGVPLGPDFTEFHVKQLNDAQVRQFVHDWYRTAYPRIQLSVSDAAKRAEELLKCLAEPEVRIGRMGELQTNPMLLTLLCLVFHDNRDLPRNRAELYHECLEVLLRHWRMDVYHSEQARTVIPCDSAAARSVLAPIAWWMHGEQDRTAATIEELATQALPALLETKPDSGLGYDAPKFLERMKDEAGVMASEFDGRLSFFHLSFQEYLAAEYAVANREAAFIVERMETSWWREVALLSLRNSKDYCQHFFREMIKSGFVETNPELAAQCLSEAAWFVAEPFIEALQQRRQLKRVAAVLRLIKEHAQQVSGLESLLSPLIESRNKSVKSAAREVMARLQRTSDNTAGTSNLVFDSSTGMTFVRIAAGQFRRNSNSARRKVQSTHSIGITKDFLLARYPVTNAQYAMYLKEAGNNARKPDYWDNRRFNQPEQPVVGVSWDDAQRFCDWAGCRLPTEAEWEYACRAGTSTAFSFGDDKARLDEFGWYAKNSGGQTQPVGTKAANPWGLHDMHGNVWEWCHDWYGPDGKESEVDPRGPSNGKYRVLRGGSWYLRADICRSSIRDLSRPDDRNFSIGFRVARTL